MATSRPFAYNPIPPGSEISGTTQFVNLAIGVLNEQYDEDYGGVKWWEGPDEDLGYIICQPISGNTQPTPISGLTASVGFYRTTAFTDSAFLLLCNKLPARKNQVKFQTTNEATVWLTANGYWTNYVAPTPTPTPTQTPTPTGDPYYYYVSNQYICPDCDTIIGSNTIIKSLIPISNNYWVPGAGDSQFQVLSGTSPYYMATTVNGANATLICGCLTLTPTPTVTPTMTPSQTPGIYYYEVFTLDENCNTTSSFIGYNSTYVLTFNYFLIDGTNYFVMPWATYDPTAILLAPFIPSTCIVVTPTPTGTPASTPATTPTPTSTPTGTPASVTPTPTATPTSTTNLLTNSGDFYYFTNDPIVGYNNQAGACFAGTGAPFSITVYWNGTLAVNTVLFEDASGNIPLNSDITKYYYLDGNWIFLDGATIADLGLCSAITTPTPTPTPTTTPGGANITLFAKTSSTSGGPYYMWYSVDSGSTFTQFSTVLTTSCVNVGTTPLYPIGTTFIFYMSDTNDPASSGGWPTNATSTGGVCPAITTLCTEGDITTTTSGTLTVWSTGNQALPNAC